MDLVDDVLKVFDTVFFLFDNVPSQCVSLCEEHLKEFLCLVTSRHNGASKERSWHNLDRRWKG